MAKSQALRQEKARKEPHWVIAICDKATDEVIQYRTGIVTDDGEPTTKYDRETQYIKIVGETDGFTSAVRLQKQLETWSANRNEQDARDGPRFDEYLPEEPLARRGAFLSLPYNLQVEVVYNAVIRTGRRKADIAKWLCLKPAELLIDDDVIASAQQELSMRVASRMYDFALTGGKSPSALTALIFCSKQHGFADTGPKQDADSGTVADVQVTVVSNDNEEINGLRAELDTKVQASEKDANA